MICINGNYYTLIGEGGADQENTIRYCGGLWRLVAEGEAGENALEVTIPIEEEETPPVVEGNSSFLLSPMERTLDSNRTLQIEEDSNRTLPVEGGSNLLYGQDPGTPASDGSSMTLSYEQASRAPSTDESTRTPRHGRSPQSSSTDDSNKTMEYGGSPV